MSLQQKELPATPKEWEEAAKKARIQGKSVYNIGSYKSASKISEKQFLALRTLWIELLDAEVFQNKTEQWLPKEFVTTAIQELDNDPDFAKYLHDIDQAISKPSALALQAHRQLRTFYIVRELQLQVNRGGEGDWNSKVTTTPLKRRLRLYTRLKSNNQSGSLTKAFQKPSIGRNVSTTIGGVDSLSSTFTFRRIRRKLSFNGRLRLSLSHSNTSSSSSTHNPSHNVTPSTQSSKLGHRSPEVSYGSDKTGDEQVVNVALHSFLVAITRHREATEPSWVIERKAFVFGDQKGKAFEARVDGYLRGPKNECLAIYEVKPSLRRDDQKRIQMQESAQMAAWICADPPKFREGQKETK